jgi:L-amino acid N-acyltransferase YncA
MPAMAYTLEPLAAEHREAVMDIFNHYIEHTLAAFYEQALPYPFFDRWLEAIGTRPACVARTACGEIVGFGFMRPLHAAPTLNRSAEVVYFLHPSHTRRGMGRMVLERLIAEARQQGIDSLLASISSRNEPSLAFHRKHGFVECGRFQAVGRKRGEDFDVVWMQRRI